MEYLKRTDIPYHYALADNFTICDAYYCSVIGPTDPNRYHMWTGWTGNDGKGGGPVLSNAEAGYDWMTYPERLQSAGINWKIYQDIGTGLTADGYWGWASNAWIGNYGDNSLLYFHQYQNAQPGSPLADKAKTGTSIANGGTLFDVFKNDVQSGNLPQVSYIVAPEAYSEHSNWPSNYGAWYISKILDILTDHPEIFSKTVVLINWDENDGAFDHMVAPTPPVSRENGLSTVDTSNEIYTDNGSGFVSGPIGLGNRVPLIAISPWSKGGYVNSQVFDHTSIIRFIEKRFGSNHPGLHEPNITPWRRAVCGDLTSIFDFSRPNDHQAKLPNTDSYAPPDANIDPNFNSGHPSYHVTPYNILLGVPAQEPGMRPARALPYVLNTIGNANFKDKTFQIKFINTGSAAAVFQVRSDNSAHMPRTYTIGAGKSLSDTWHIPSNAYELTVHGPNGFYRVYQGNLDDRTVRSRLDIQLEYISEEHGGIKLHIRNSGKQVSEVMVLDAYTGKAWKTSLPPQQDADRDWSLHHQYGWYDLVITDSTDPDFTHRLAGHVETGRDSMTDPALGSVKLKA